MYQREIIFDRETGDYALYLSGDLVGFAKDYVTGENMLDQLVSEMQAQTERDRLYQNMLAQSHSYKSALAAGDLVAAAKHKARGMELYAQLHGCTVDDLISGRAA